MSNAVYPVLKGLTFRVQKRPTWRTDIFRAASGREVRIALMAYPLWEFGLPYSVLRDQPNVVSPPSPYNELKNLAGFYLSRQGAFDSFLFNDITDNSVTDQNFGTGDGVATQFGLVRSWGGFVEPVQNVNVLTNIKKNGVTQTSPTDYTIDSAGLVTFTSAPTVGHPLTWTGTYHYRCRFMEDNLDLSEFMANFWELEKVNFVGSPANKV